ncbi:site-specific integrase [Halarcobacter bivalviorum]|uniref:Site-specific integrase n=1 Tax=Halarcobacter bivalviorum TaxID=663364 RepID=A0AAX2A8X6_9BACT|nr:site-specific integrase [Halarcobacter bivalviorum]AXH12389.1 site-specific tyrosine recombinase, phage integrase family (INT_ICEBs1_C_like domain) [Halarcobacter bivalviorum]RXK10684.1 site-specific integrase [Halarcobacter bivalviorum]
MNSVKVLYGDLKITIRSINSYWWLDFYFNKKRIRRSTNLKVNEKNLKHIKSKIIPEIVIALTGNSQIKYFEKDLLVKDFSVEYFNVYRGTVRDHVYKRSKANYENKIKPFFGNKILKDITPIELEQWQLSLLKKYKPQSVNKYRSVFFSIFEKALQNDLIKFNPLTRVKSPLVIKKKIKLLVEKESDTVNPFSIKEIKEILSNARGNLYYVILFMFLTGIRPGELISLTWKDIDFEKKKIAVEKTTVQGKVGDVKTQSSVRYIDMLPQTETLLKDLYNLTGQYDNLFISHFKKPFYSHDILNLRFKELLKEINIKERTIYNLRHTFASYMISNIQNGIDILWVSKMLGHKDLSITLKIYAKYIKEDDDTRFTKLNKIGTIMGII